MDVTVKFKTTKEYEMQDLYIALHKALERGHDSLRKSNNDYHADMILEILNNSEGDANNIF